MSIALPSSRLWAPPAGDLAFQFASDEVVIECENYHNASGVVAGDEWELGTSNTPYSGSGYMEALPNDGDNVAFEAGPWMEYRVNFPAAGDYDLYVRSYGASGSDDSFYWELMTDGDNGQQNVSSGSWTWATGTVPVTTVGVQLFRIYMREDGMQLDKIVMNTTATAPTGTGPTESSQA